MKNLMKKQLILVALVLTTLLMAACNPLAKFQPPDVQLSNLKVLERSGFEQLFLLQLKVINPNKMALRV